MEKIISAKYLKKYYSGVKAVDGVSFEVNRGGMFAFLGVNGAGKSTTMEILCTLLKKDAGEVQICGYDLDKNRDEIKKRIGVVFQNSALDRKLSVEENLVTRASFYGLRGTELKRRIGELSEIFGFDGLLNRTLCELSGGQRRKIDLARGLIGEPEILFLDEPATGLDPKTRLALRNVLRNLQTQKGMTVFFTTHYMEEAADADAAVIMDNGRIAARGTPNELKDRFGRNYVKIYGTKEKGFERKLRGYDCKEANGCLEVKFPKSEDALRFVKDYSNELTDVEIIKGNMDDVFLNVTGKKSGGNGDGK
jgi:multidrug/hemolysin transport system ATP-binding protein